MEHVTSKHRNISEEFSIAQRPVFLRVDLDAILNNLKILKGLLAKHTEIIGVVKANAYGHGSVWVAKFLEKHGISHFAVATALEGEDLRTAGLHSNIQVFGNASEDEIPVMYKHRLIPTVADLTYLSAWSRYWRHQLSHELAVESTSRYDGVGSVIVKVDTGMSRNGCQPEELPSIMKFCENNGIAVHSIMTHFAQSWDDPDFTQQQLNTFLQTVEEYRRQGVKVHVANSGAVVNRVGVDLDYVRPGISMYGQPPDTSESSVQITRDLGLRPAISWYVKASKVNRLPAGRVVGYDKTYTCSTDENIAVIHVGYADGYLRSMSGQGCVTTLDGTVCPVVGRVSMDAITVKLPEEAKDCREFCLMTADFNDTNSCLALARIQKTISYEICTNLSFRISRVYIFNGKTLTTI